MKVVVTPVEPVEPDVVITLSAEEARQLSWYFGKYGTTALGVGRSGSEVSGVHKLRMWLEQSVYSRSSLEYTYDGSPL